MSDPDHDLPPDYPPHYPRTRAEMEDFFLPPPPRSARRAGRDARDTALLKWYAALEDGGPPPTSPSKWGPAGRGHTADEMFPGLLEYCRGQALARFPDSFADDDPVFCALLPDLRERVAQSMARTVAVVLEYEHAMKLAAAGLMPPDSDGEWEIAATQAGLPEVERDRWKIVKAAVARARGAANPKPSLDGRLRADADADPGLFSLNSDQLAKRHRVSSAAVRQTRWWKEKRVARERAKQELKAQGRQEVRRGA